MKEFIVIIIFKIHNIAKIQGQSFSKTSDHTAISYNYRLSSKNYQEMTRCDLNSSTFALIPSRISKLKNLFPKLVRYFVLPFFKID